MNKLAEEFEKIEEQEQVVYSKDDNLIVSASAGSGKTSVMIRRIINLLINEHYSVSDLLVLTYTTKAASEMKQKLLKELKKQATKNADLIKEIDEVALADISTIDSFCQKLVKKYFYILDIDPSFEVLQGSEQKSVMTNCMKKAIASYKKSNADEYAKIFEFVSSNRTDKKIYENVLNIYNFCCSILNYDEFKKHCFELTDSTKNKASNYIFEKITKQVAYLLSQLKIARQEAGNLEKTKCVEFYNKLESSMAIIAIAKSLPEMISHSELELPRMIKANDVDNDEVLYKMGFIKNQFKEIIEGLSKFGDEEDYTNSLVQCGQTTKILLELNDKFSEEYSKYKTRKNMYDYNDIERKVVKLLEHEKIKQIIQKSYKKIFVDEFQDSNLIQETIIRNISDNNLFFVGDLKQAIYGFRQSDSRIFERIVKEFAQKESSSSKFLNCNFRTNKDVIEFINKIFCEIMTEKSAQLDYKNKAQLFAKAKYETEHYSCVDLSLIKYDKVKQQPEDIYDINSPADLCDDDIVLQAKLVASKISELLNQDIYDTEIKAYRKIEYRDIVVLFRKRANQKIFKEVLNSFKIPTLENSNDCLEETYDVKVLMNLIRCSLNYKNDYYLASVMNSPLFDFSYNDMIEIKNSGTKKDYFYNAVKSYNGEVKIKEKIDNMFDLFDKFKKDSIFSGLMKSLTNIVYETEYIYKVSLDNGGLARTENISNYIASFSSSPFLYDIEKYVLFIDDNTREQKVMAKQMSSNVVEFTTMHSSKGLEYPVVIIPELESNFNSKPNTGDIILNDELGIGINYYDEKRREKKASVFYEMVKSENKNTEFAEKIRLLYVAFTRAKNRLILIGTNSNGKFKKFKFENEILYSSTYLDLIVNSLDESDIEKINSFTQKFNIFGNDKYNCFTYSASELQQEINETVNENKCDKDILQNLLKFIDKKYPFEKSLNIAQKNSVSKILKDDYSSINLAPNFLTTNEHLKDQENKNEIGSFYHKVLELVDFKKCDIASLKLVVEKIKKLNLFDENVIKQLNYGIIMQNIAKLNTILGNAQLVKEHSFIMQIPYSEVESSTIQDKILVQGICDLIANFDNKYCILIDYKFSSLNEKRLKEKYKKQILLYKKAIEKGLKLPVLKCYILSLVNANLIEIMV